MTGGTWRALRCCGRFDGLAIVGPSDTEHFTHTPRGALTRRAAAPVAPPPARPRKPAPLAGKPATVRAGLADGFGLAADGSHGLSGGQIGQRAVGPMSRRDLRRELETLRGKAGPLAAQRRAFLKRQIARLDKVRSEAVR